MRFLVSFVPRWTPHYPRFHAHSLTADRGAVIWAWSRGIDRSRLSCYSVSHRREFSTELLAIISISVGSLWGHKGETELSLNGAFSFAYNVLTYASRSTSLEHLSTRIYMDCAGIQFMYFPHWLCVRPISVVLKDLKQHYWQTILFYKYSPDFESISLQQHKGPVPSSIHKNGTTRNLCPNLTQ